MLHIFILLLIILFSKSQPEDSAMKEGISKTMLNSSKKLLAVRKCANCESLSNRGHVFSSSFGTRKSRVEDKFRGVEQNWQQEYPNPFNKDKDLLNGSNNKNSNHIYKSLSNTEDRFDISNIFKTSSMESDKVRMPIEPVMFGNYEWRSGFYNLLNKRDLLQDIDQYKPMFNADDKIYNKNNLEYLNHLAGTGCHSELNSVKTHALHEPSVAFYENVEGEELVSHEHDSSETELLRTKLNNGSIDQVVNESTIDTGKPLSQHNIQRISSFIDLELNSTNFNPHEFPQDYVFGKHRIKRSKVQSANTIPKRKMKINNNKANYMLDIPINKVIQNSESTFIDYIQNHNDKLLRDVNNSIESLLEPSHNNHLNSECLEALCNRTVKNSLIGKSVKNGRFYLNNDNKNMSNNDENSLSLTTFKSLIGNYIVHKDNIKKHGISKSNSSDSVSSKSINIHEKEKRNEVSFSTSDRLKAQNIPECSQTDNVNYCLVVLSKFISNLNTPPALKCKNEEKNVYQSLKEEPADKGLLKAAHGQIAPISEAYVKEDVHRSCCTPNEFPVFTLKGNRTRKPKYTLFPPIDNLTSTTHDSLYYAMHSRDNETKSKAYSMVFVSGTTEMPITSSTSKLENLIDKLINHSRYETTKSITIIPTLHQRKEEKYAVSLKTVPLYKKLLGITPKIELHQNSVPMPVGPLSCPIIKGNKIYPIRHKGGDQGNHYYHAKHSTKTSHSDLLLTEKTNPLFGHVSKTGTTPITADFSTTESNINKALGKTIKVETNTKIDNCVVNDIRNILNQSLNF